MISTSETVSDVQRIPERRNVMSVSKRIGFVMTALLIGMLTLPVLGQANNGGGNNGGRIRTVRRWRRRWRRRRGWRRPELRSRAVPAAHDGRLKTAAWRQRRRIRRNSAQNSSCHADCSATSTPRRRGMFGGGAVVAAAAVVGGGFGGPTTQPSRGANSDCRICEQPSTIECARPMTSRAKLDTLRQARPRPGRIWPSPSRTSSPF